MPFCDFFKPKLANKPPIESGLHLQKQLITDIATALQGFSYTKHDIIALKLHLLNRSDKVLYDTLLTNPDFKKELDRTLESIGFKLPAWNLGFQWVDIFPDEALQANEGLAVQLFKRGSSNTQNPQKATIEAIKGQLKESKYSIEPNDTRYNIGRNEWPILETGRAHQNHIVLVGADEAAFDDTKGKCNLAASRAHAYILYDAVMNQYCLYAYAGGLPISGNSTKIFRSNEETVRVMLEKQAYPLANDDQIELGGKTGVLLLFKILS